MANFDCRCTICRLGFKTVSSDLWMFNDETAELDLCLSQIVVQTAAAAETLTLFCVRITTARIGNALPDRIVLAFARAFLFSPTR